MTDPQQPYSFPPAPPAPQAVPAPGGGNVDASALPSDPPVFPAPGATPGYPSPGATPPGSAAAPAIPQPDAPAYQAPAGAYQVPTGGYAAPAGGYTVPAAPEKRSAFAGVLALVFAAVAAVVMPIIAGIACYAIGVRLPAVTDDFSDFADTSDLSFLSPVRDQVLWAELSFWGGTLLGVAAIVIGIIAIVQKRGRWQGIVATIFGIIAPVVFFVVAYVAAVVGAVEGVGAGITGA